MQDIECINAVYGCMNAWYELYEFMNGWKEWIIWMHECMI